MAQQTIHAKVDILWHAQRHWSLLQSSRGNDSGTIWIAVTVVHRGEKGGRCGCGSSMLRVEQITELWISEWQHGGNIRSLECGDTRSGCGSGTTTQFTGGATDEHILG